MRRPDEAATSASRRRGCAEADAFYASLAPRPAQRTTRRSSSARRSPGLVWGKQSYHYDVAALARRRPGGAAAAGPTRDGRNTGWRELNNARRPVDARPWEYPWYAAWDLAFHCLPLALIDPDFAKSQLLLL